MSQPENRNQNTMYIDQWYGDTEVTCVCFFSYLVRTTRKVVHLLRFVVSLDIYQLRYIAFDMMQYTYMETNVSQSHVFEWYPIL